MVFHANAVYCLDHTVIKYYGHERIGISIPAFWLWRVYHFIVVDDVPDPVFGIDFCSVFSVCTANNGLPPDELPVYHIVIEKDTALPKQIRGNSKTFALQVLCGAIFIPLFVLFTILYVRIGHFLWVRTPVGTGDTIGQLARKKRVAWALFWLIITFFFCRMCEVQTVLYSDFYLQKLNLLSY